MVEAVLDYSEVAPAISPVPPDDRRCPRAAGRAALDAMITRQAQIIAYIDDYKLLMIAVLAVIPLLVVFKKPSGGDPDHALMAE